LEEKSKMSCDIIIPVWNQLELTRDCIEHIVKNTHYPYRLIIIDNASDKETQEYLNGLNKQGKFPLTLIRNAQNLGYVKAINQGLRISNAPYVCLLNNDTRVIDGWLVNMVKIAEHSSWVGIVSPTSAKDSFEGPKDSEETYIELAAADGFCMLIKREVIEKVGLFDEIFGMGMWEEIDYSRRIYQAGYICVRAKNALVYHFGKKSFGLLEKRKKERLYKRNREIFYSRWGRPPRVIYLTGNSLKDRNLKEKVVNTAYTYAKNWHIVYLFLKKSTDSIAGKHASIIIKKIPDTYFYIFSLFEILKPKKQRIRYKYILLDNLKLARLLRICSLIHQAEVVLV
jgi:GT2 family glycosyltransferase